jgi:hypothetical protein
MACHHNLEEYLLAYLDKANLREDPKGPLFRTVGRGTRKLTVNLLVQANAHAIDSAPHGSCRDCYKSRKPQSSGDWHDILSQNSDSLEKAAAIGESF